MWFWVVCGTIIGGLLAWGVIDFIRVDREFQWLDSLAGRQSAFRDKQRRAKAETTQIIRAAERRMEEAAGQREYGEHKMSDGTDGSWTQW